MDSKPPSPSSVSGTGGLQPGNDFQGMAIAASPGVPSGLYGGGGGTAGLANPIIWLGPLGCIPVLHFLMAYRWPFLGKRLLSHIRSFLKGVQCKLGLLDPRH
eukprot:1102969-Amphidinium_carterae.1